MFLSSSKSKIMIDLQDNIQRVANSRNQFLQELLNLSHEQAQFKPSPDSWSICEITEHMVWAENIGINRMWRAVSGIKNHQPVWKGNPVHEQLTIEEIISKTWQTKEKVPDVAKPIWGGPIDYWVVALRGCQPVLEKFVKELEGLDPLEIIYPHPISGPLNIIQRIDFLGFHLDRHQQQILRVKANVNYPSAK